MPPPSFFLGASFFFLGASFFLPPDYHYIFGKSC